MVLEGFTVSELSDMHTTAGAFAARMYESARHMSYAMAAIADAATYENTRKVRDVAMAAARESEELMVEIGAEMARRDYRDAPDGH